MCIKTVMISVKFEVCSIVGKNKHTAEILLDDSCKTINSTDFPLLVTQSHAELHCLAK